MYDDFHLNYVQHIYFSTFKNAHFNLVFSLCSLAELYYVKFYSCFVRFGLQRHPKCILPESSTEATTEILFNRLLFVCTHNNSKSFAIFDSTGAAATLAIVFAHWKLIASAIVVLQFDCATLVYLLHAFFLDLFYVTRSNCK